MHTFHAKCMRGQKIMKNIYFIINILFCAAILAGCQQLPEKQAANIEQNSKLTSVSDFNNSTDTYSNSIYNEEINNQNITNILEENLSAKHLCYKFESEEKVINIDANVNISGSINEMCVYKFVPKTMSDSESQVIVNAFFGERGNDFKIDEISGAYILNPDNVTGTYSTAAIGPYTIINTHKNDYNPFYENRILDYSNMKCAYSEEEAIELCSNFLKNCNFNDYYLKYIQYFGKLGNNYYYKIAYAISVNNFPTTALGNYNEIFFYVDNDGLMYAEGNIFDLSNFTESQHIDLDNIITAEDAVEILKNNMDIISVGYESGSPVSNSLDKNGGINNIFIWQINLGYYLIGNEARPCWFFDIGQNVDDIDSKAFLAVDLISGDVKS